MCTIEGVRNTIHLLTNHQVSSSKMRELEVFNGSLLDFQVSISTLVVLLKDGLDAVLDLGVQVDELDVGREEKSPGANGTEWKLVVEELKLHHGSRAGVTSYEVTKLSQDIPSHFYHVFVTCRGL